MLHRIQFRTVSRLRDQANILRNDEIFGAMPTCLINLHHDEVLGEDLADLLQEEAHHLGGSFWQINETIWPRVGATAVYA